MNKSNEKKEKNIHSFNVNIPEIIAKRIVDKLISLAICTIHNKKQISQMPINCFNFTKSILNGYISWNFISYDKEEKRNDDKTIINNTESQIFQYGNNLSQILGNDTLSYYQISNSHRTNNTFDEKLFYNNYIRGVNDWNIVDEPKSGNFDKYASTLIKLKHGKIFKYHVEDYKVVQEEEDEDSKKSKDTSKISLNRRHSTKLIKFIPHLKSLLAKKIRKSIPKKISEIMNEFSFYSIKDEKEKENKKNPDVSIDVENYIKELEAQKKANKLDLQKINKKKLIQLNKLRLEEEEFKKYQGKSITKDHNGEIIIIKKRKSNELKKEFYMPRATHRFIREEIKPLTIINNIKNENNKEKEKENSKSNKKIKKDIILNPIEILPSLKKSKTKDILFPETKRSQNNNVIIKTCYPSGDNFNLMNMEVGVMIKQDNKYKSGGKDFFSKFKKFSIQSFDKQLKEELELNSIKYQTKYARNYFSPNNNNYKNLFLSQENAKIYNDNISQKFKSNISLNTLTNNSISKTNKVLTNVKSASNISTSLGNNESNKPMILLSNGSSSINDIFNREDNIININDKKDINKKNIFRESRKIKSLQNIFTFNDINNFNKAILTKKNMVFKTSNYFGFSPKRKPAKPLINEIYREIGFNKMISRNRKKIISLKKPMAITTLEFFKH